MNFNVVKACGLWREQEKLHGKISVLLLQTNGVLLDDDKLSIYYEHMHNLVLSIDGRKEVHDQVRKTVTGGGSYDIIAPKFISGGEP